MEGYEEYKDSGVDWIGEIPRHWSTTRVRHVVSMTRGSGIKRDEVTTEGHPCVRYGELYTTYDTSITEAKSHIPDTLFESSVKASPGDLVMALTGETKADIGPTAVNDTDSFLAVGGDALALKNPRIDSHFLAYALASTPSQEQKANAANGDIVVHLSTVAVANLEIALPPEWEQHRIGAFLTQSITRLDAQIESIHRQSELLGEYRKSVISEAVTKGLNPDAPMKDSGIGWLGTIPASWGKTTLGLVSSSKLGRMLDEDKQTRQHLAPYLANRNVQWFRIDAGDLNEMDFPPEVARQYEIIDGDVLICEGGEVGRACVWHGDTAPFYFQKAIHRLRVERTILDPDFIAYTLFARASSTNFVELRKGESTIAHLTGEQLEKLIVVIPPLGEQAAIVAHLDAVTARIDSLIEQQRALVERLKEYRQALITECVTGKIRVPGVPSAPSSTPTPATTGA